LKGEVVKTLNYSRFAGDNRSGEVVYQVFGERMCVFSGITSYVDSQATINVPDAVVQAICQEEKVEPDALEFYDLQTHQAYPRLQPGKFSFNRIYLKHKEGEWAAEGWVWTLCPREAIEAFAAYIGGETQEQDSY
jgi:hypothetical protein